VNVQRPALAFAIAGSVVFGFALASGPGPLLEPRPVCADDPPPPQDPKDPKDPKAPPQDPPKAPPQDPIAPPQDPKAPPAPPAQDPNAPMGPDAPPAPPGGPAPTEPPPAPGPTPAPVAPPAPPPGGPNPSGPAPAGPGGGNAPAAPPAAPVEPPHFLPGQKADELKEAMAKWPADLEVAMAYQDAMVRENRRDEAVALFTQRKNAAANDPAASMLLGRLQGGAAGRTLIQAALTAKAAFPEALQALAELEEADEKLPAAKTAAESLAGMRGSPKDWTYVGFLRQESGDSKGAHEAYGKAIALDPRLAGPRIDEALLLSSEGKAADGLALLAGETASHRGDAFWHVALALVASAADKKEDAKVALEQALEIAANDRHLLIGVVAGGVRTKTYPPAQAAVQRALDEKKADPEFLAARAVLSMEAGKDQDAETALADAMKLAPGDARLLFLAGVVELRLNRADKAIGLFKKATAADPTNARYAFGYANALDRKGNKEALAAYQHAAELDPDYDAPLISAGLLLIQKGTFDEAASKFESASKVGNGDPIALYYLAIVHGDKQGLLGKALDDLREYAKRCNASGATMEKIAKEWLDALEEEQN
jgi:tetratricopeptide (TPR) repeat protein